ncbi:MAG: hypothetical protein WCW67_06735 [Candidatus Margulisiibacteriota bacterium]
MKLWRILFPVAFILLMTAAHAIEVSFPYVNLNLKLPPLENPYPGFGSYFTTISLGQKTVLWNPASLSKLKLSEYSLDGYLGSSRFKGIKTSPIDEQSGSIDLNNNPGNNAKVNYGIFFREQEDTPANATAAKVDLLSQTNAESAASGLNFSAAQRVNEWLVVGFSTRNPVETDLEMAGIFPVTGKMFADLHNFRSDDLYIDNTGILHYTFRSGSLITTTETTAPVWSGFLSQEVTIPVHNLAELRNDLKVDSPFIGTIAGNYQNFHAGLNLIPISAYGEIDNDIRTVVPSDATDQLVYVPNFDPNDPNSGGNWMVDPDLYGTSAGYSRKQIKLPSGEIVANAKYRGFYRGTASRFDLGMMYDVNDWLVLGLMFENFTNSAIAMKGSGLSAFYSYRQINTEEAGTLFQPGSPASWSPISDHWVTSYEAGETKLLMEEEKIFTLPKRFRYGVAFKRPFLIALDWEQNQNPITLRVNDSSNQPRDIVVRDLNFLHVGIESQLFLLPITVRYGLTWLFKPTATGLTADEQKSLDNTFAVAGGLPPKMDLGALINLWGYKVEGAIGYNALSIINVLQFDSNNLDLSKTVFGGLAVEKEPWKVAYQAEFDPASTASAYGTKGAGSNGKKEFNFSDIKLIQSVGITYRF